MSRLKLKHGSLFTGIGGFDLGFERAGIETAWQVENNKQCVRLLEDKFPDARRFRDVRGFVEDDYSPVDVISAGDPCPKHSRARSNGASRHPDLSGYVLAVVGRLRPRWLVRENVPAPTVDHFATGLECLGYGVCVIRIDAAQVTGQSRQRDFVVGCDSLSTGELRRKVFTQCQDGSGTYATRLESRPCLPCLGTHRTRCDSREGFVWEPSKGLRILECEERERLAGFSDGWTAGVSAAARARMCGNAVVPAIAQWLGERIVETNV